MRNYATNDYRADLANAAAPIALFAGADDELMDPSRYADAIKGFESKVTPRTIAGVNHMAIVSGEAALAAIVADAVAIEAGNPRRTPGWSRRPRRGGRGDRRDGRKIGGARR